MQSAEKYAGSDLRDKFSVEIFPKFIASVTDSFNTGLYNRNVKQG